MRKDLYISLILAILSFIAGFFVVPYQLRMMPEIEDMLTISVPVATLLSAFQLFIMVFLLSFAGCKLSRRASLSLPFLHSLTSGEKFPLDSRGLRRAVVAGAIIAFVIVAADRFYFVSHIPYLESNAPEFSAIALAAGVL